MNSAAAALQVSAIGFGCLGLNFGRGTKVPKQEGIDLIRVAFERGVTFFDTAELYGPFTNEEIFYETGPAVAVATLRSYLEGSSRRRVFGH